MALPIYGLQDTPEGKYGKGFKSGMMVRIRGERCHQTRPNLSRKPARKSIVYWPRRAGSCRTATRSTCRPAGESRFASSRWLKGYGYADYLLYMDKQAIGALEAKPVGFTLSGVKPQVDKYSNGLPASFPAPIRPLPFLYVSTGVETNFVNLLDPEPRSRRVFSFHRPETIAEWMQAHNLPDWIRGWGGDAACSRSRASRTAFVAARTPSRDAAGCDCQPVGEQAARARES